MESQRLSSRAILVHNGEVLLVRRQRFGDEYFVLPGGGIEPSETALDACHREILEETGLDVPELRCIEAGPALDKSTHVYWAIVDSQEVRLGEIEADRSSVDNRYELVWIAAERVAELELRPAELKAVVSMVVQKTSG